MGRIRWWHAAVFYGVLLIVLTVVSHGARSTSNAAGRPGSPDGTSSSASPAPPSTRAPSARPPSTRVRSAHAPSGRARSTSQREPASSGTVVEDRVVGVGIVLPDRSATPGAINRRVTQSNIGSTICRSGYTASIRPDSSYTTALKRRQLQAGYKFHHDSSVSDYEEDHLISLELGGSAVSPRNLWPEPYLAKEGAWAKDKLENRLHALVCDGTITLRTAQRAIAGNWWAAYRHYVVVHRAPKPPPERDGTHRRAHHRPPPGRRGGFTAPTATPTPVQHSCTTTSSGSCIQGGEFCPQASYGMTGYDADGTPYICEGDSTHPHWEIP